MHVLVCFAHIAAGNTFTTAELYAHPGRPANASRSLQSDFASLRSTQIESQALGRKTPQIAPLSAPSTGLFLCLVFLKLFERVYSPLTVGLLQPYRADSKLQDHKRTQLDRLYQKIVDDLDELLDAVGLKAA
jgi:hypothetical protein